MVAKRLREGKGERTLVMDYDTLARKLASEMAWVMRGRDGVVIKTWMTSPPPLVAVS